MSLLSIDELRAAQKRISGYVKETPILSSETLNKLLGHEVYFKAEGFQKVGAFKARGACNALAWISETKKEIRHIVANSSGNHAQAIAWAATQFGKKATIYMPANVSKVKLQATKAYGAEVILCETRQIADHQVEAAAAEPGNYWVPPYNHNKVMAGQGTATMEALAQVEKVDAIFAPCGGGGLLSGTLTAARALSPHTQVIGIEPLLGNDAARSLRQGRIHRLDEAPKTIADGARTLAVGSLTFPHLQLLDGFYEAPENEIIYWTQWLTHLLKVEVEPTSAMSMYGVTEWLKSQNKRKRILVILSGANIDTNTQKLIWLTDHLGAPPHPQ